MTLQAKIETAREALAAACHTLCMNPRDSIAWRNVCTAKARLVALLNCGGR